MYSSGYREISRWPTDCTGSVHRDYLDLPLFSYSPKLVYSQLQLETHALLIDDLLTNFFHYNSFQLLAIKSSHVILYSFSKISFLLCGVSLNFTFIVTRLIGEVSSTSFPRKHSFFLYLFRIVLFLVLTGASQKENIFTAMSSYCNFILPLLRLSSLNLPMLLAIYLQIFVTLFYDFCNKWFFQEQNPFVTLFDDLQRNFVDGFNFQSRKSFLLCQAFDKIILFYDFCNSFIGENSMIIFMTIPLMCNSYWIGRFEWEKWRPFVHLGQGYLLVIWF